MNNLDSSMQLMRLNNSTAHYKDNMNNVNTISASHMVSIIKENNVIIIWAFSLTMKNAGVNNMQ